MDRLANFIEWFCQFASKSTFRRIAIVTSMRLIVHILTVIATLSVYYLEANSTLVKHLLATPHDLSSYFGFMLGALSVIGFFIAAVIPGLIGLAVIAVEHEVFNDLNNYLKGL